MLAAHLPYADGTKEVPIKAGPRPPSAAATHQSKTHPMPDHFMGGGIRSKAASIVVPMGLINQPKWGKDGERCEFSHLFYNR